MKDVDVMFIIYKKVVYIVLFLYHSWSNIVPSYAKQKSLSDDESDNKSSQKNYFARSLLSWWIFYYVIRYIVILPNLIFIVPMYFDLYTQATNNKYFS